MAKKPVKEKSVQKPANNDLLSQIESSVISSSQFIKEDIPKPEYLLYPWLSDGSIHEIYATRGIGKTFLALMIASTVSGQGPKGRKIGPWEVMSESGVLFLDGEMGEYYLQDRLKKLGLNNPTKDCQLDILSASRFFYRFQKPLHISNPDSRNALYKYIEKNKNYFLLILDNVASLTPGINENSKEDWDPINQWLLSLKHIGVATIFIHHAGKGDKQRGTSAREDALDCVIKLTSPPDYNPSEGASFIVSFEKSRNVAPGADLDPFCLQLNENEDGFIEWTEVPVRQDPQENEIIALLLDKSLSQKQIATMVGTFESTITGIKQDAIRRDFMDKNRMPTEKGKQFLEDLDLDLSGYYEKIN